MLEVRATAAQVRRAYDAYSYFYGRLLAPFHRATSRALLERARIGPRDRVLEVAIGPATSFDETCRRTSAVAVGIDLSWKMLQAAGRKLQRHAVGNAALVQADARFLPFRDQCLDVVLSSHFLELLPAAEMGRVVGEFYRVLRPGGRLVLASMSKPQDQGRSLWERIYRLLPAPLTAYLLGACRPVFAAAAVGEQGFTHVQREYCRGTIRSEVVSAEKPVAGRG
jgi:ubiquinone/menaquinone biosynthesis C-methylase UbiE